MEESKDEGRNAVSKEVIKAKVEQLRTLKAIASKSKLAEKDALELGEKINQSMHKRYQQKSKD